MLIFPNRKVWILKIEAEILLPLFLSSKVEVFEWKLKPKDKKLFINLQSTNSTDYYLQTLRPDDLWRRLWEGFAADNGFAGAFSSSEDFQRLTWRFLFLKAKHSCCKWYKTGEICFSKYWLCVIVESSCFVTGSYALMSNRCNTPPYCSRVFSNASWITCCVQ